MTAAQAEPDADFAAHLSALDFIAGQLAAAARLRGPLTAAQTALLAGRTGTIRQATHALLDMARHHGALVVLDPEACEICGYVGQPEYRHLTSEHYGQVPPG